MKCNKTKKSYLILLCLVWGDMTRPASLVTCGSCVTNQSRDVENNPHVLGKNLICTASEAQFLVLFYSQVPSSVSALIKPLCGCSYCTVCVVGHAWSSPLLFFCLNLQISCRLRYYKKKMAELMEMDWWEKAFHFKVQKNINFSPQQCEGMNFDDLFDDIWKEVLHMLFTYDTYFLRYVSVIIVFQYSSCICTFLQHSGKLSFRKIYTHIQLQRM